MLIIRPACPADTDALLQLARDAGAPGLPLPGSRSEIEALIANSTESLSREIEFPSEERYLLLACRPGSDTPLGMITLRAAAGHPGADYSYRNDTIIHSSPELGVNHRLYALSLSHDLSGHTMITPAVATPSGEAAVVIDTLTRAALMLVADQPERFSEHLIAPLPGMVDQDGRSPFWDAVGSKFFGVPFAQADQLALGKDRTFLAELMPHHPIYVPLLPESAQQALGQTRDVFMSAYSLLLDEGFEAERYVDIFDGGPIFYANRKLLALTRSSRILPLTLHENARPESLRCLISNLEPANYRVLNTTAYRHPDDQLGISAQAARLLELNDHDEVRCVFL